MVSGETPFKASKNQFMIGASESGYQVAYSADKETWTLDDDAIVPANENLVYNGCMMYGWYKLSGNTSEVAVIL